MRVLMLSKACLVGVYQKKLEEMAAAAPDLALTVVVPPAWKDNGSITRLERAYTEGYNLQVQPLAFNGAFHLHFYPRLGKVLKDIRPDIVHIDEEPYNLATYHANCLARRSGARTLWFSWQNLQRRYPPPFSWMERYNLRNTDYALVGSHAAAEVWRAKGYAGPLAVIPQFGVDPEIFRPASEGAAAGHYQKTVHIAYVGRLVPEKGVDTLLEALAHLNGPWRASIIGRGSEATQLQTQAAALDLTQRVDFRGYVPASMMPEIYREMDVLVLPSRTRPNWTEQFGRVLIEAMASGVAVLGSQTGEIPYVIGEAGGLFPEDDVAALSELLQTLIDHPQRRQDLARQGRSRVLNRFTQRHVAEATLAVYREIRP